MLQLLKKTAFVFSVLFFYIFNRRRRNILHSANSVGLICYEYFHMELGQFGGYGKTVQRMANFFNKREDLPHAKVLISVPYYEHTSIIEKKVDDVDIIVRPKIEGSYICYFWKYALLLKKLKLEFFLTIDYYESYEYVLKAAPHIPLIVWIRDPRGGDDWKKLTAVKGELQSQKAEDTKELLSRASHEAHSIDRIRKLAKILKRKVIFVTNGQFLVQRARDAYQIPDLKAHTLMNPLSLPDLEEITFAKEPTLLFIGRFASQKRFWIAGELAKMFPSVRFVFAGIAMHEDIMSPIFESYRNLPNIEYAGIVEGQVKEKLFRDAWALLNTSVHEGLPVTFLEAFSYGKTVISSVDPEGLVERFGFFTGDIHGDGVDGASLQKFAVLIEKVISDRKHIVEKGQAARRYIEENHSFAVFEKRFKEILELEGLR